MEEERDVSMEAFVRKQAGKDILRKSMEKIGESIEDPLPIAQALYERKAASKLTVDLAEPSDFPMEGRNTTFLSTMYHSIEKNHNNFSVLLDVLRMFPSSVGVADQMQADYGERISVVD